MRDQRELLFFVTTGFLLVHFAADDLAGRMEQRHLAEGARAWEVASLWGIGLAAVLPVAGIGVLAGSAAFELSRKARSLEAKHQAARTASPPAGNPGSVSQIWLQQRGGAGHDASPPSGQGMV